MNVVVSNSKNKELSELDIDVIKSVVGEYEVDELVSMFKSFFYEKMIIDITAIKNYADVNNIERLAMSLGAEKIILLLTDNLCTSNYLSSLIDTGVYNFTNNIKAIKRLIARPNAYEDVKKLKALDTVSKEIKEYTETTNSTSNIKVLGIKNITKSAGTTTLIYMLLKTLKKHFGNEVYAIEVDTHDFKYFNEKNMLSVSNDELKAKINSLSNAKIILLDLNQSNNESLCQEVIYLVEPSIIMLNRLISTNRNVFEKIKNKKIVLNKSCLSNKDVTEFEYEANIKVFYNIPALDDHRNNNVLEDFLSRLSVYDATASRKEDSSKIFGLFGH
ncbi:MAG: hypothetical protein Q4E39_01880 [bacterium]|nr:hypothetical protein [bacterium]